MTHQRYHIPRHLLHFLRQLFIPNDQIPEIHIESMVVQKQRRPEAIPVYKLPADTEPAEKVVEEPLDLGRRVGLLVACEYLDRVDSVLIKAALRGQRCNTRDLRSSSLGHLPSCDMSAGVV
jgi:hypothetical protein